MTKRLLFLLLCILALPAFAEAVVTLDSGCYFGTGATKTVTIPAGFTPAVVTVKAATGIIPVTKTSSMPSTTSIRWDSGSAITTAITALGSGTFTLGTANNVNSSGVKYCWWAMPTQTNFVVGTYTGNGGGSQAITGLGFSPEVVLVISENEFGAFKTTNMASTKIVTADDMEGGSATDKITVLGADGFTVGAEFNDNAAVYYYLAWNAVAGGVETGTYTGTGVANRVLSTGCPPSFVGVLADASDAATNGGIKTFADPYNISHRMTSSGDPTNNMKTVGALTEANNFTLDDATVMNKTSSVYYYFNLCSTLSRMQLNGTAVKLYPRYERGYAEQYSTQGSWGDTSTALNPDVSMSTTKYEVERDTTISTSAGGGSGGNGMRVIRATSLPLTAGVQTTGGRFRLAMPWQEGDAAADCKIKSHIYIVNDAGVVQRTLLINTTDSTELSASYLATGYTGQPIDLLALSFPYTSTAGDRIIAEIGYQCTGIGTTNAYAFGGESATDYAVGDAHSASKVAWIEFTFDLPSTPTATPAAPTSTPTVNTPTVTRTPTRTAAACNGTLAASRCSGSDEVPRNPFWVGSRGLGNMSWVSPGNACSPPSGACSSAHTDLVRACVGGQNTPCPSPTGMPPASFQTQLLRSRNFGGIGFPIPDNAVIKGVEFTVFRGENGSAGVDWLDDIATLNLADNTMYTVNKRATDPFCNTTDGTTCEFRKYGSYADLWGTTITPDDVNSPNFGFLYAAESDGALTERQAYVGCVIEAVCYEIAEEDTPTPTPIPTPTCGGLNYDTNIGHVSLEDDTSLHRDSLTFETWFKWDGRRHSDQNALGPEAALATIGELIGTNGLWSVYMSRDIGDTTNTFTFWNKNTAFPITATWSTPDTEWHLLAVTLHENGDLSVDRTIYLDATDIGHDVAPTTGPLGSKPSTYQFRLGQASGPTRAEWGGRFDEVRLYEDALTPADISAHYNGGLGQYCPLSESNRIFCWHLDEGSGSTVHDFNGFGPYPDGQLRVNPANYPEWSFGIVGCPVNTPTPTFPPTATPVSTRTFTITPTITVTRTPTNTLSATRTRTVTPTPPPSGSATRTPTLTPSRTGTRTPTFGCVKVFNVPRVGESSNADNRFTKQVGDAFPICCTYTRRMRHEDRVTQTSASATLISGAGGCDAPATVIGTAGFDEQQTQVFVQGGTDGCSYKIRWNTQTRDGSSLVCDVRMDVAETDF